MRLGSKNVNKKSRIKIIVIVPCLPNLLPSNYFCMEDINPEGLLEGGVAKWESWRVSKEKTCS